MKVEIKQSTFFAFIFFLICYVLTAVGLSDYEPFVMSVVFFFGISALWGFFIRDYVRDNNDIFCISLSYVAKIVYALYRFFFLYGGSLTSPKLSTDAKRFWNQATSLYSGTHILPETKFPAVLNFEFHFFGRNLWCFMLFNIFLTMIMMVIVIKMLNRLEISGKNRFISLLIVGLLPYEIIVSCSVLRESIYFVFVVLSFYLYYRHMETKRNNYLLFSIVSMIPVVLLHVGYFPIILIYFVDSFRNDKVKSTSDLFYRLFMVLAFACVVIIALRMDSNSAGYVSRGVSGLINKITGETGSGYADEAGSRYLAGLKIDSFPTLILYTPIRWLYFLLSPLPTNWRGVSDIAAFALDSCVHLFVICSSVRALKILKLRRCSDEEIIIKQRTLKIGLLIVLFISLIFCLNTNTAGTAIRHRDVLIGVEAVLIALSGEIKESRVM